MLFYCYKISTVRPIEKLVTELTLESNGGEPIDLAQMQADLVDTRVVPSVSSSDVFYLSRVVFNDY